MKELERTLRTHARRYPLMEPADAVKLVYQNEFGGGHLIRDRESALDYLRREYAAAARDPDLLLFEDIGNGIYRVNLGALEADKLDALGEAFLSSAAAHQGTVEQFRRKLEILRQTAEAGAFSFDTAALEAYLAEYEQAGYPMVSHSAQYRQAYRPAYRVVKA